MPESEWYVYLTHDERKMVLAADEAKVMWERLNVQRTRLMHVAFSRKRRLELLEAEAAELTSRRGTGEQNALDTPRDNLPDCPVPDG